MRTCLTLMLLAVSSSLAANEWENVTDGLAKKLGAGYGGLCGVLVDRATGHVFLNVSDKGLYRSTDHGSTFAPFAKPFKGRTEWPGCLRWDPTGKSERLLVALVYGSPVLLGERAGGEWTVLDKKSSHVDWCVVDWSDPQLNFMLAFKHESGGMLLRSLDGGKSFSEIGKGFASAWIFDNKTAVAMQAKTKDQPKPKLIRTTDAGETWKPVAEHSTPALPQWRDGKLYWLVDSGLLMTDDLGKSWTQVSKLKDAKFGPVFGKDADHHLVLTRTGIVESRDGGKNWAKAIPLPTGLKGWNSLTWFDYDPKNDIFYVMKMTSELYRLKRK